MSRTLRVKYKNLKQSFWTHRTVLFPCVRVYFFFFFFVLELRNICSSPTELFSPQSSEAFAVCQKNAYMNRKNLVTGYFYSCQSVALFLQIKDKRRKTNGRNSSLAVISEVRVKRSRFYCLVKCSAPTDNLYADESVRARWKLTSWFRVLFFFLFVSGKGCFEESRNLGEKQGKHCQPELLWLQQTNFRHSTISRNLLMHKKKNNHNKYETSYPRRDRKMYCCSLMLNLFPFIRSQHPTFTLEQTIGKRTSPTFCPCRPSVPVELDQEMVGRGCGDELQPLSRDKAVEYMWGEAGGRRF